ncbi:MAG: twin-arginine translocase TatA/TatE family subunit [Pirellulales bacterium]|nr:twin-arginine translocase TatA/TatE family subunit [Pirellulales bacterium]
MLPNIGSVEMVVIGVIAVLLFGKNLPSVGRSLGRSFVEFKKGLSGIQEQINSAVNDTPAANRSSGYRSSDDYQEPTAPRFEPPATKNSDFSPPTGEPRPIEQVS